MDIYNIIKVINETNSTNEKIRLIREYKNNALFKKILNYIYDPNKKYNIIKLNKDVDCTKYNLKLYLHLNRFTILDYILEKKIKGNEAICIIRKLNDPILTGIVTKTLFKNLNVKLINKAFGFEFIRDFKVQLALPFKPEKLDKLNIVELKYDGVRIIVKIVSKGNIVIYTRNGKIINDIRLKELLIDLSYVFPKGYLDGELIYKFGDRHKREAISGFVNKLLKNKSKPTDEDYNNVKYVIFDYLTEEEWLTKITPTNIRRRFRLNKYCKTKFKISEVTNYWLYKKRDIEKILELYKRFILMGYEGIMIKQAYKHYNFKRSDSIMKIKERDTLDLEIIDIVDGLGKYENMTGAIVCRDKSGKLVINVGSGLTDDIRKQNKIDLLGKIVEIGYNYIITDKDTYSLYLPVFLGFRFDKNEPDNILDKV